MFLRHSPILLIFLALAATLSASAQSPARQLIPDDAMWKRLESGQTVMLKTTETSADSSIPNGTAAILIKAAPTKVWAVIDDKEAAADYIDGMLKSEVIGQEGGHDLIEQTMKIGFKKVTYVVRHISNAPGGMSFRRESGDLKSMDGYWKFIPVDGGERCLVIYRLSLDPGMGIPKGIVKASLKTTLPNVLRSLKAEVARRG